MFSHLFKLIWNKKKQNFLLITEIFVSFIVMFAVFTLLVYYYHNYNQPMGFDYSRIWVVNYKPPENLQSGDSTVVFHDVLTKMVKSYPQVEEVSFASSNVPFSMSTNNTMLGYETKNWISSNVYQVEPSYQPVLGFKTEEGRWFNSTDRDNGKYIPVVINEKLKETLFGKQDAVGKIIAENQLETKKMVDRYRVIGVITNLKDKGDYQAIENGVYMNMDTGGYRFYGTLLIKVKESADAAFESKLSKSLSNVIGTNIEIEHLDKKLDSKNKLMLVPMLIALIVAGFLIINVALGLFGVLWYNISRRRSEIALRRAIGATGISVSKQLVGEALVLATIALLAGCFLAVQFPLLNVFDLPAATYLFALAFATVFIYLIVVSCALYPGRQAAAILPAIALHEE